MKQNHRTAFLGVFLIIGPPVAALALAALAVDLTRHDEGLKPTPALYDALFPVFFIASFLSVPIGIWLLFKAIRRS